MSYKQKTLENIKNMPLPTWKRVHLPNDLFSSSIDKADIQIISKPSCAIIEDYNSPNEVEKYDSQIINGLGSYFINYTENNYKNGFNITSSGSDMEAEPLHIKHVYSSDITEVESNIINVLASNHMTVYLDYQSKSGKSIHHGNTRFNVSNGARLNVIRFQNINSDSYFLSDRRKI